VADPAGLRWETFFTFGEETEYGEGAAPVEEIETSAPQTACGCPAPAVQPAPEPAKASACCGVPA